MREIKFRAWDKKNKEMYYIGQEFDDEYGCAPYLEINKNGEWYWEWGDASDEFDLDNKIGILMQYTGLKDKNGKEIYGGDIIQSDDYDIGGKNVVEFKNGEFLQKDDKGDYWCISPDIFKTEILGNIYENKDLLTK